MATQFLLVLDYPCCTFPIGIFKTAEAALKVIAGTKPPQFGEWSDDWVPVKVQSALQDYRANTWIDLGHKDNQKPLGYAIQKFVDGCPGPYTVIEPYENREPKLPDDDADDEGGKVDPEQELAWTA